MGAAMGNLTDKIKVIVVEDQAMPRQLFKMMLEENQRYELLYALESASVVSMYCDRYAVDLVIMDVVMMDGSNGLEAAERIKKSHPEVKIIIVTSMPEISYIDRAKKIGVESFWYKENWSDIDLLTVMDRTMNGERVYPVDSPEVYIGKAKSTEITRAEFAVLRCLTRGMSNAEIAEELFIGPDTVKTHISSMLQKTGLQNRTELAIKARATGLVIEDDQ
jgi:two-component system vancomycin resistance associated response regulator VraR